MPAGTDLGVLYRHSRERVAGLVATLDDEALAAPVPACPGWAVRDVVAHLVSVAEDVLAGRLTGPPTDDLTAAQVARHAGESVDQILGSWSKIAPDFEPVIGEFTIWPAVVDVVSHEHDIRGALARPGDRDSETVRSVVDALLDRLQARIPILVRLEDTEIWCGDPSDDALELSTTRFETLRFRTGRRSRRQMAAMGWSADASGVIDALFIMGPATLDVLE